MMTSKTSKTELKRKRKETKLGKKRKKIIKKSGTTPKFSVQQKNK